MEEEEEEEGGGSADSSEDVRTDEQRRNGEDTDSACARGITATAIATRMGRLADGVRSRLPFSSSRGAESAEGAPQT